MKTEINNFALRKFKVLCDLNLQIEFWLKTVNFLGICNREIHKLNLWKTSGHIT